MGKSKQLATMLSDAPAALDTLDELAAALGDDANFATTVTNSIATKAPLTDPKFSGNVAIGANSAVDSSGFNKALDVNGTDGAALYLRDNTDSKMGVIGQWNGELSIHSKQSDGTIKFYINNGAKLTVDSSGNLGIGTGSPSYKLDVGHDSSGSIQARLKSSGDTGYTQGAMIIESSDSANNPGNRGQGVYYYNVPNARTWYGGTFYNNGNKFGFGYKNNAGLQTDAADTGNARMIIDGDSGNVFFNELGNRGDLTFPICSISNNGNGGNYLHAQFQVSGGAMWHIHFLGYDYVAQIRQGSGGGYIYNTGGQTSAYNGAISGHCAAVHQTTTNRVELVINTGGSATGNRWGSMVFFGGTDTITGNNPITLVQYGWNSSTSRLYSS